MQVTRFVLIVSLAGVSCAACGGSTEQVEALPPAAQSASATTSEIAIDVSDPPAVNVTLQVDETRAARGVLSTQGGSITATGADGSTFTLTIPSDALLGEEEIILTPLTGMSGLPDGVTLAAGVQLAPDGLLLLKPGILTIEPKQPVPPDRELPVGWARRGERIHAPLVEPKPGVATFPITHFSGAAITSASSPAAASSLDAPPAPCSGQYFSGFGAMIRRARVDALMGRGSADLSTIADKFIENSNRYLKNVLIPIAKQAEKDDLLLPCAASAVFAWERQAQVFLGPSFEQSLGESARALRDSIWRGFVNLFNKSVERCQRGESPLFQLGRMSSSARMLTMMGEAALLPADNVQKILTCARAFTYHANVESEVENVYNEQGQGALIESSKTRVTAQGIVAEYDAASSGPETPVFTGKPVTAEATVSITPRKSCPDKARVEPGSTVAVTIKPIINVRVGQLKCQAGKARCDATDTNPGVLVVVMPHVVESTFQHTYSSGKCTPDVGWNEFMMLWTGRNSVGSEQPFQVRGERDTASVVRYGTSVRRMPINIAPQLIAMNPGMKDYVEINTPAIKQAIERTKVSIEVKRR